MTKVLSDPVLHTGKQSILLPVEEGAVIPRIIHQTFMTKNLPVELQNNIDNLKKLNPGWAYILHDDNNIKEFIKENYGERVLRYYERINPRYGAARADLFRYLLVYKCGGVYLDIKSTCTCPLDEVLQTNDRYILSHWRNKAGELHEGWGMWKEVTHVAGGEYQQWHIIAAPGHPFLKAVIEKVLTNIDNYRPWLHETGFLGVLRLTGPLVYTTAIYPLLSKVPYREVANETVISLNYNIYKTASHRALYKKNYALLIESVVQMKGKDKLPAYIYNFKQRVNNLKAKLSNFAKKGKRLLSGT